MKTWIHENLETWQRKEDDRTRNEENSQTKCTQEVIGESGNMGKQLI